MGASMTPDELSRPEISELINEHKEAKRLLTEVEKHVDAASNDSVGWARGVTGVLEELVGKLRAHFEKEEGGCLYTEVPIAAPRYAATCTRLLGEHAEMLSGFATVQERLHLLADERIGDVEGVAGRIRMLIASLRRHEAEENELLMSALWEDIGSKD